MKPLPIWCLLMSLPLGGCVAGMATSAVGMAVRSARGTPQDNRALTPSAQAACSARAAAYGTVHVIDLQQVAINKIRVWGTAGEGTERRSFECDYGTRVTGFKLRKVPTRR